MVTLEDILADVVGGLRREGDEAQFIMEELEQGKWRLSGNVWLEDFRREYPQLQRAPGVDTIGGLVSSQQDSIPPKDTIVEFMITELKTKQLNQPDYSKEEIRK